MNIAQTKCVTKCTKDDSGAYLSSSGTKCVNSCATSGLFF